MEGRRRREHCTFSERDEDSVTLDLGDSSGVKPRDGEVSEESGACRESWTQPLNPTSRGPMPASLPSRRQGLRIPSRDLAGSFSIKAGVERGYGLAWRAKSEDPKVSERVDSACWEGRRGEGGVYLDPWIRNRPDS